MDAASLLAAIATIVGVLLAFGLLPTRKVPLADTLHYILIVDSSKRMASGPADGDSKWNTMRESIVNHMLNGLPPGASYSLFALGGKPLESTAPCDDIPSNEIVPMKRNNGKQVLAGIDGLEPRGVASLDDALEKARQELFELPGDEHRALFLFLGGGDECGPDPWKSLRTFLEDSAQFIDARIEIVILPGESVDESVKEASRIIELVNDLELDNVGVYTPRDGQELEQVMGQIQGQALEDARPFEPSAVAYQQTLLDEASTSGENGEQVEDPTDLLPPASDAIDTPPAPTDPAPEAAVALVPPPGNILAGTAEPTQTATPVPTLTRTFFLPTSTATHTPSIIVPAANTQIPTWTATPTGTATQTSTHTQTPTNTSSPTVTPRCSYALPRQPLRGTASYSGQITIENPEDCSTGHAPESAIDTHGTYSGTSPGTTLWVLVYPQNGLYYPQSPNACATPAAPPPTQVANSWSVSTYLGKAGNDPEWFDIVVVLVDQQTSEYLSSWLRTGCLATPNDFTGIQPDLLKTKNITEITYITVQTR